MRKIALDSADFEKIINKNKIYVDKTDFLYDIVADNTYYFLSRPRRYQEIWKNSIYRYLKGFFRREKGTV